MSGVLIVDSSLLIEADHRRVLPALENYFHSCPHVATSQRVYEESVTEPRSLGFGASAARIDRLFSKNLVKIEQPDYADGEVSNAVDRVRKCIARRVGKPEHVVERADLQIVGLAFSYAKRRYSVEIIFRDNPLKVCLERVMQGQGVSGITVVDFKLLLQRLSRYQSFKRSRTNLPG